MKAMEEKKPLDLLTGINPNDLLLIQACAKRAYTIALDVVKRLRTQYASNPSAMFIDPDPVLILMDICNVHARHPINLREWFASNDLLFAEDYVTLTKNVDRACGGLPNGVKLRFAAGTDPRRIILN